MPWVKFERKSKMSKIDTESLKVLVSDLSRVRDEALLKVRLGTKDVQDEWEDLELKWKKFSYDAELEKSETEVKAALQLLGAELRAAYQRLSKAV